MKEFLEKWRTDNIYRTKIKLGLSTLFVIAVSIFAFSTASPAPMTPDEDNQVIEDTKKIEIPDTYDYIINIKINDDEYQYKGSKNKETEDIIKIVNDEEINYYYKDNTYYKNSIDINNETTKEEVYDIVNYNYINLETINEYLSISTLKEDNYLVYLKDIVLGTDSEEYIVITKDNNKLNIDYTSLIKLFDKTIESYEIEVIIEEKE